MSYNPNDYPEETVPSDGFVEAEVNPQAQAIRNKLYALASLLVPILAGFNFATAETINLWVDLLIFIIPEILLIVAWLWSRKNKAVVTLDK